MLPYITEEIYNEGRAEPTSVHKASWPEPSELPETEDDGTFDAAVEVLTQVRRAKSEARISLKVPVLRAEISGPSSLLALFEKVKEDVAATVNIKTYDLVVDDSASSLSVSVKLGDPEPRPQR